MRKTKDLTEGRPTVNSEFRCGTIALAGRSNVGKSTLMNRILGAKVAIETSKPQATRFRVLGIRTTPGAQCLWTDLPGIHRARSALNLRMVETARRSIHEADLVVVVLEARSAFGRGDAEVTELVAARGGNWLIALNKIDLIAKEAIFPLLARLQERFPGRDVIPVSARTGDNVEELERYVASLLPLGPALYPEDELTDQTGRAIVQEFVREKIFEVTGDEIPYRTAVVIDTFVEKADREVNVVQATILVERDSQKRILVGKGGAMIREIGSRARRDLETFFGRRFFLELFVKVQRDWTRSGRMLDELGL